MKETLNLTRILFKNSLNKNFENISGKKRIVTTLLIMFLIAYIIGVMGYLCYELINSLKSINQEQVFLTLCLMLAVAVTLFKTIITSLNVLYFSKDVEFLLPLPIKPINIVLAKFNVMLISEYITELITFVVPFAMYGYMMKVGISFYINSLVIFLFLPIIPMIISTLIMVIIMKFAKFLNNKDFVQYLSVILTIIIVVGIQFFSTSSEQMTDFMIANKMLEINGLAESFSKYIFTVRQATTVLTTTEVIEVIENILLLGVESIVVYIVGAFLASKMYLKTAIFTTSSSKKNKKIRLNFSKQKTWLSYIQKENRLLCRNPVFFLQCVLPSILFPIIFSIPLYRTFIASSLEETAALRQALGGVLENTMGIGIILIIINFFYMFNFISVTAISRDGENANFMKYIPIELHLQCKYKVIPSILCNMIPLIYIIGVIIYLFENISWVAILEIFVIGLLCNVLISYITILIDILRPKLHWTSEYSVVKQNMNMLYSAILVFVAMGVILVVATYCENIHLMIGILSLIIILVLIAYEVFLRKYSRQIFRKVS